jgi:AcrR family transcriptional regulator
MAIVRDDNDDTPDRRSRMLESAKDAFLRFGFERSSMADIAAGAGVSRTALYHYFPSKEEVLRSVVEDLNAASLAAAREALEKSATLEAALRGLLDAKFGRVLARIGQSPHGVELVDATHRLTGSLIQASDEAFHALVVKALRRHGRGENADAVADTLIAATKGLMRSAEAHVPKATFDKRLRRLVAWVAA